MKISEILQELPQCDTETWSEKCCWKNGVKRLAWWSVAINLQFVKNLTKQSTIKWGMPLFIKLAMKSYRIKISHVWKSILSRVFTSVICIDELPFLSEHYIKSHKPWCHKSLAKHSVTNKIIVLCKCTHILAFFFFFFKFFFFF